MLRVSNCLAQQAPQQAHANITFMGIRDDTPCSLVSPPVAAFLFDDFVGGTLHRLIYVAG